MERTESCSREYTLLFNGISDAIEEVEGVLYRLKRLQAEAEEVYLSEEEYIVPDFSNLKVTWFHPLKTRSAWRSGSKRPVHPHCPDSQT